MAGIFKSYDIRGTVPDQLTTGDAYRIGKAAARQLLEDLMTVPPYEQAPAMYSDWGDPREFSMGDIGMGECAGEVVSALQFELATAERLNFEAQLAHEAGDFSKADELAYGSMLQAARGLVHEQWRDVPADPVNHQNHQREQDAMAQFLDLENVSEAL